MTLNEKEKIKLLIMANIICGGIDGYVSGEACG